MRLALFAATLVACGHPPAETKHPVAAGSNTPAPPGGKTPPGTTPMVGGPLVAKVLKDLGCPAPTCVYHAGGASYFTCLAGGAGLCFHFGSPCAPVDNCMYDASDRTYKTCAKPVEGACAQYGAGCAPTTKCMFDPADSLHHHCDAPAGGKCTSYGALCAP